MKKYFIEFFAYVAENYVKEDVSSLNKFGKIFLYGPWLIHGIIMYLLFPIFIPEFIFKKSKLYKEITKILNSPEFQKQQFNGRIV